MVFRTRFMKSRFWFDYGPLIFMSPLWASWLYIASTNFNNFRKAANEEYQVRVNRLGEKEPKLVEYRDFLRKESWYLSKNETKDNYFFPKFFVLVFSCVKAAYIVGFFPLSLLLFGSLYFNHQQSHQVAWNDIKTRILYYHGCGFADTVLTRRIITLHDPSILRPEDH